METNTKQNKKLVVLGIYQNRAAVSTAVDRFRASGFRAEDISALMPAGDESKEFAHEKGTKAPEGATAGTAAGALLGGTLGWLVGIGSLAIPGLGALVAAGPIMGLLAGAGAGGAVGAVTGALIGLGFPEYEAKRYEGRIKEGGILVSVHCDNNDWKKQAMRIFEETGATDIASSGESKSDADTDRPRAANY